MIPPLEDEAIWLVLDGGLACPHLVGAGGGSEEYNAVGRMELTVIIRGAGILRSDR